MRASTSAGLLVLSLALLGAKTAGAEDFSSLGFREDTVIESDGRDDCIGALVYNHDYSFENGYCWRDEGAAPPYYGALAEGFDLGAITVECAVIWLTNLGDPPAPLDVYVWDGGVAGAPAGVLCMIPGVDDLCVGYWPSCCENDIEVGCCVNGDFAVGYWVDFDIHYYYCREYCCADENGLGGHPWTNIAPGIGYPTGWQHPNVVWPNCKSMGIGAIISTSPSPSEAKTWGEIKGLFRTASR